MLPRARRLPPILPAALVAGGAYLAALAVLLRTPGTDLVEALFLLGALGLAFPALAWGLTRRPRMPPQPLSRPPTAVWPVLAYLSLFSVLVLGWGFDAVRDAWPDQPAQSLALLVLKLLTMVALPTWFFLRMTRQRPLLGRARLWVAFTAMALSLLAFQAVFGRGLTTLRELGPDPATLVWAIPLCWLWQIVEAGLCEELLFRRVLQQRIADATGSQAAAVLWASLLFGLAHAPGLYLRGAHLMEGASETSPVWALAWSVVMIAPAGIVFGVLWARTRSLWLIVVLHGTVDLLPQLAPFIREWTV